MSRLWPIQRLCVSLATVFPNQPDVAAAYIRDCILREATTGISRYGVHLKQSDELIGFCGFKKLNGRIDFGWRYAKAFWRHGYGTEAAAAVLEYGVATLHLSDIGARSFEENLASVRIIEKLGFVSAGKSELNGKTVLWFAPSYARRDHPANQT
jgi:RimJ/RimL family protein N-acetyltransferase